METTYLPVHIARHRRVHMYAAFFKGDKRSVCSRQES